MPSFSKKISQMQGSITAMQKVAASLTRTDIISFGGGAPAKEAYPIDLINEISNDVFKEGPLAYEALSYGTTSGFPKLKRGIREHLLEPNSLHVEDKNILVTAGGIQAIYLTIELFVDPGDIIIVEAPTYIHCNMIFECFGAKLISCSMDEDGLNMEELEEKIKKYNPKMVYTIPTFQNPTGRTMSKEKRKKLAELAAEYNCLVLEDDPYSEIRYSGEKLAPIKSYDTSGNVIYINSFSKIFAPGARLGYAVADEKIINGMMVLKLAADSMCNGVTQVICGEFFERGYYEGHIKRLCDIYRERRDIMTESVDKYFPEGTKRTSPDGGYYVWVELPNGLDASALLPEVIEKTGITYGVGADCFITGEDGGRFIRLCFSSSEKEVIADGIAKIGQFFCSKI